MVASSSKPVTGAPTGVPGTAPSRMYLCVVSLGSCGTVTNCPVRVLWSGNWGSSLLVHRWILPHHQEFRHFLCIRWCPHPSCRTYSTLTRVVLPSTSSVGV